MSKYSVRFDDQIAADWMMVEVDGGVHLVLRRDRITAEVLEEAWAAYCHLAHVEGVPRPRRPLRPAA